MRREGSFERILLVSVTLGFAALVVAVLAAAWGFQRTQETSRLVNHTFRVELTLGEIRTLTERVETARRGFLIAPDERFFRVFGETEARLPGILDAIGALVSDNPVQVSRVELLRAGVERQRLAIARSFETRRVQGAEAAQSAFAEVGQADVIRELRDITNQMVDDEQRLLAERSAAQSVSLGHAYVILGIAGAMLLLLAAGTLWTVRRNLLELKRSRDTLRDLNDNLEVAVEARTADLQRANEEIQRFAYIVSHDLRSPLVNVMGFTSEMDAARGSLVELVEKVEAEAPHLVSEDARLAAKEDLPEAIGFIRSSTQKMDRLINAILRLSREGRRVIAPEPLKVGEIVDGISASLAHRAAEIGAEIKVENRLPGVVSDRLAVEQILSNLIENALKYRDASRPVRVRVEGQREGERVVFAVRDNGRGIDPRDHDRVFDLFRRSGAQDQPGEGIGLAHVRALAYRLGGNISCASELGKGSTFTLVLPAVYRPRKEG